MRKITQQPDLHSDAIQHDEMASEKIALRHEMADRLKEARLLRGFLFARDAARRYHWVLQTYAAHENGSRGFTKQTALTYAKAFAVNAIWLLSGEGPREADVKIRIEGYIGAGAMIYALETQDDFWMDEVESPVGSPDSFVAFIVRGDSNYPALKDREIVICKRDGIPASSLVGVECAMKLADGRRLVKTIAQGSLPGRYTLLSFNHPPIVDQAIDWASKVEWVKKP